MREKTELFIVEGDSAGGSAKQGRDRDIQAVLPLRGKVLNTESVPLAKVLENKELADLVVALGCGIGKDFDITRLRYARIILLADADSDGHHITTLLLTFFYRHLHELIKAGRVFVGVPPLYRIDCRQGDALGRRRGRQGAHPQEARQGRGEGRHHALQGPRRDDAEGALGDDALAEDAPPLARRDLRTSSRPTRSSIS